MFSFVRCHFPRFDTSKATAPLYSLKSEFSIPFRCSHLNTEVFKTLRNYLGLQRMHEMSQLPFIPSSRALGSNLALHPLTQSTFHYLQRRETQIFVPGLRFAHS